MNSQVHEAPARRMVGILSAATICILMASATAVAAPINHGNFGPDLLHVPPGVTMYQNVTESSGTDPLPPARYGPPTINGSNLDFDPMEFVASATAGGIDVTDVQLNFTLMTLPLTGVTSIMISEGGDYSLFGAGTALTSVAAAVSISIKVLEVDNVPLVTPLNYFASNAIVRDLVSDGPVLLAPWSNGLLVNLTPLLNEHEINFQWGVSKAEIVINDQLVALSEPNSMAFIAKKDFTIATDVIIDPDFVIPEPATCTLMLLGFAGFTVALRGRLKGPAS